MSPPDRVIRGPWKVRCSATARSTGQPCGHWAVRGASVCAHHGAAGDVQHPEHVGIPNQKTAAAQRLNELRREMLELGPVALDVVRDGMRLDWRVSTLEDGQRMPVAPAEPKDRLKAAEIVLNRLLPIAGALGADEAPEHRDIDAEIESELELLRAQQSQAG